MNIVKIQFNDYTAEINLSCSANCLSLKNEKYNVNILREADYSMEIDNPFIYGMPIFLGFHTTFNIPFIEGSLGKNVRIFTEVGDEIERNDKFCLRMQLPVN